MDYDLSSYLSILDATGNKLRSFRIQTINDNSYDGRSNINDNSYDGRSNIDDDLRMFQKSYVLKIDQLTDAMERCEGALDETIKVIDSGKTFKISFNNEIYSILDKINDLMVVIFPINIQAIHKNKAIEIEIKFFMRLLDDVYHRLLSYLSFFSISRDFSFVPKIDLEEYERNFKIMTNDLSYSIQTKSTELTELENRLNHINVEMGSIRNSNAGYSELLKSLKNDTDELYKKVNNIVKDYNDNKTEIDQKFALDIRLFYLSCEDKIKEFTKQLDEVDQLIKYELDSITKTSRNFNDFISDETSIKLTDDYKTKAKNEMRAYYFFNILSLVIIGIAIQFSYSSLTDFATKHAGNYNILDLIYLGIRLVFSILIFSTIGFTSRLASKSYIYWKKNEGIFLRLTALKSFIADLPKCKQEEIHEKLVDVYFGKDEQDQNLNQKLKDLPNNITQLLGKVVDQTSVVLDVSRDKSGSQNTSKPNNDSEGK